MPDRYEKIRDSLIAKGHPIKKAKTLAAKIFNASRRRGEKPVTGKSDKE